MTLSSNHNHYKAHTTIRNHVKISNRIHFSSGKILGKSHFFTKTVVKKSPRRTGLTSLAFKVKLNKVLCVTWQFYFTERTQTQKTPNPLTPCLSLQLAAHFFSHSFTLNYLASLSVFLPIRRPFKKPEREGEIEIYESKECEYKNRLFSRGVVGALVWIGHALRKDRERKDTDSEVHVSDGIFACIHMYT